MIKTIPSDFIGKENVGYVLLASLSESSTTLIADLLKDISRELPGLLWPMPHEQMHITLCEIIQPKSYHDDKDTLFALHKSTYEDTPASILSKVSGFTVSLDILECSSQAIIIKSSDATSFNAIRAQLVNTMELPNETRTPPDIIHTSIARYVKEVDLEKVQRVLARHQLVIKEEITEFQLLRTEVQPLQKYEVLRSYNLL